MHKGQIYVRATLPDGVRGNVDVLELDDESFRVFAVNRLLSFGAITVVKDEYDFSDYGDEIELRADPEKYTPRE